MHYIENANLIVDSFRKENALNVIRKRLFNAKNIVRLKIFVIFADEKKERTFLKTN